MRPDLKAKAEQDLRVILQDEEWQKRFLAIDHKSPLSEWQWLCMMYCGDQDELDHLINKYLDDENRSTYQPFIFR